MRGFLFDLDGVIVDTAHFHYLAWKDLAGELGFDFPISYNERQKGVSRMESLDVVLEVGNMLHISDEEKLILATKKNDIYLDYIREIDKEAILPGVVECLETIKQYGYKTALGSASKSGQLIIEKVGLMSKFDAIVDGNLVTKAKPNSMVFLKGAELLGLEADECTVIEDAQAGILAAKNAGMRCIGIGRAEDLSGADILIGDTTLLSNVIFEEGQYSDS